MCWLKIWILTIFLWLIKKFAQLFWTKTWFYAFEVVWDNIWDILSLMFVILKSNAQPLRLLGEYLVSAISLKSQRNLTINRLQNCANKSSSTLGLVSGQYLWSIQMKLSIQVSTSPILKNLCGLRSSRRILLS